MMQDTPSMIANFPDAIRCGVSDYKDAVFILMRVGSDSLTKYFQVGTSDRCVIFNLDGSYNSRKGHDLSSKGCLGQSVQQLYDSGRAFNIVNDPEQAQKILQLEEENALLKKQVEEIIQKLDTKFDQQEQQIDELKKTIEELQKSMPKEITSNDCFEIFKKQDIEVCIKNTDTRMTTLEPLLTIAKSNICIDGDIFDLCIEKFEEKGIVICGETSEYKMFE